MAAHRYWRVYFDTSGSAALAFAALRFYDASGTRLDGSGTPTAGSTYPGYPVTNLFDGDKTTFWHANNGAPDWVKYDFLSAVDVAAVHLQARESYPTQGPTAIRAQWSDDNATWTDAVVVTGIVWAAGLQESKAFAVAAPAAGAYAQYRLATTTTNGAAAVSCATLGLRATIGGANLAVPLSWATSEFSATTYGAAMAFDGNASTFWSSNGAAPQNLVALLGAPKALAEFVFQVRPDGNAGQAPKDFTLDGSNDGGKTWTTVKTVAGATGWASGESRTYSLSAGGAAVARPQVFVCT